MATSDIAGATDDLLQVIRCKLAADRGPSGFDATVALGVDGRWLLIECGARANAVLQDVRPAASAVLILSSVQADAVLRGIPIPNPTSAVFAGDDQILKRFVARYLSRRSMVALRAHAAESPVR